MSELRLSLRSKDQSIVHHVSSRSVLAHWHQVQESFWAHHDNCPPPVCDGRFIEALIQGTVNKWDSIGHFCGVIYDFKVELHVLGSQGPMLKIL